MNLSRKNKHIKSVSLNRKPFAKAFIEHQDIVNGGVLELDMGSTPSKIWGTKKLPLSKSDE